MGLFDFLKTAKTFETEIEQLKDFTIVNRQNSKVIEIKKETTFENIVELLLILKKNNIAFSFFDSYYPSPSDPGAYFDYSQEKNETDNAWSMTLGNHGWTGGIYTITENNIIRQIHNLIKNNQIDIIRIDNVKIFSHYDKENADNNKNQNALIFGIHSGKDRIKSNYLIFGIFSSDNYYPYSIYKLTSNQLFEDKRGTWHSDRHTKTGYVFQGELLPETKFQITKELLNEIPIEFLTKKWRGFYTTGNKNEDQLILEFEENEYHKTISIDSYELNTDDLSTEIKNFRRKIESITIKLNE
ncbi:hypothetical protein [Flavobacterium sp. 14A]|uniref:hypothetical protein n=1 Tax=Flavobacterium sp. 14A TaxID=2735896 RepID=UPI001570E780|nr:hypothetical protein [Flavobacterium sp. 14A]NRT13609.1 hypothetical protein [Flavobacterium sp. 14A]